MKETMYDEFKAFFNKLETEKAGKMTQVDVAKFLDISQASYSRIRRGVQLPNDEIILKIRDKWGVDLTDMVAKAKADYEEKKASTTSWKASDAKVVVTKPRLPVTAAAGTLSSYVEGIQGYQCEQMPIVGRFPDYDFTMFIKGNSMSPRFESGDEIALKKTTTIEWGREYVLDTEEGVVFKRVYDAKQNLRLVSYNSSEYPDFMLPKDAVYGFYKYVGLIRV